MLRISKIIIFPIVLILLISFIGFRFLTKYIPEGPDDSDIVAAKSILATKTERRIEGSVSAGASFEDNFSGSSVLEEAGSMSESRSKNWWLNSGAKFIYSNGIGRTVQGELSGYDPWRLAYKIENPEDTDNGYHPQNIFRLVTRSKWKNFTQQVYFKINKDNLSSSENRNASNGVLLFNRYQSGQTLYYAGLRVDGAAVVKKKLNGTYYTMSYKQVFSGSYNESSKPDLIPSGTWIGIKTDVTTNSKGEVVLKLYTDVGKTGSWKLVIDTKDTKGKYGKSLITNEGYAGIRTDFADVDFSNYKISQF